MRLRHRPPTLPWDPSRVRVYPGHLGRAAARRLVDAVRFSPDSTDGRPAWASDLPDIPFVEAIPTANSSSFAFVTIPAADAGAALTGHLPVPTASSSLPEVTTFIRAFHDAVLAWLTAADAAGVITPALIQRAISDATVSYAFGEFQSICVDSLASPDQRSAMDAFVARMLGRVDWQARPLSYVQHRRSEARRTARAGEPLLEDYQWWITSQCPRDVWLAFDPVDPTAFEPGDVPIVSTCEVYGDDAGDFAVDHRLTLIRDDLRVVEITSADDAAALISRYPIALAGNPQLYDEWAGIDAPITHVLDWEAIAQDYDGVRLSVPAALEITYAPLPIRTPSDAQSTSSTRTGMITGWTPGSTLYLRDPGR